ncbi:glycosyltransferase [Ignisphaera sp. 4213-co]|uniref:Glycosyltransferase n=1 Tax=Ignisphaera cupida TaxID=3050454 RepID=A0ABD4Z7X6_9CREN|nr:glycosyltransferase [Ignisphaera sp. 4213-co]MDK6028804.1 glycosyltransferase [Ignisphaera sp. 4213-co]
MSSKHVVVAHHFWGRPGGGQIVCAAASYAFNVIGYEPVLASVTKVEVDKYVDWFGIDLSKYPKFSLYGFRLRSFGIYLRLFIWKAIEKAVNEYGAQIVFTDESTYGPIKNFVENRGIALVEYIHFPIEISIDERFRGTGLYYGEDPYILERYSKFPMNMYWWLYTKLLPRYLRKNPFEIAKLVLANSKWTAELAKQVYGEKPEVLNPPIAPNVEIVSNPKSFDERENSVVMLGRFSEEKRYHWVIEEVLPKIRREAPNTKLYIFGGARTKTSMEYLKRLEDLASRKGFKTSRDVNVDADVYLVPDAPRNLINHVMDKSKAFLHATINEHWGIAVAEAMARGLPVVVHKSGGAWSDLVEEGAYGLGYTNAEEAVSAILNLLTNENNSWRIYSRKSIEKSKNLTLENFVINLSRLLAKIL